MIRDGRYITCGAFYFCLCVRRNAQDGMSDGYFPGLRLARALCALVILIVINACMWKKTTIAMLIRLRVITFLHRYVIANDISPAATEAMRRNIALNGLGPCPAPPVPPTTGDADAPVAKPKRPDMGKVRVSEMDAV